MKLMQMSPQLESRCRLYPASPVLDHDSGDPANRVAALIGGAPNEAVTDNVCGRTAGSSLRATDSPLCGFGPTGARTYAGRYSTVPSLCRDRSSPTVSRAHQKTAP